MKKEEGTHQLTIGEMYFPNVFDGTRYPKVYLKRAGRNGDNINIQYINIHSKTIFQVIYLI